MSFRIVSAKASKKSPFHANEDRVSIWDDVETSCNVNLDTQLSLFLITDGHGGARCSHFLSKKFADLLVDSSLHLLDSSMKDDQLSITQCKDAHKNNSQSALVQALANTIDLAESTWTNAAHKKKNDSGACLTAALVGRNEIAVANVGDCKAILIRKDGSIEVLTADHRADVASETKRIQQSGGYVKNGYLNGILQPSRTIGDLDVKRNKPQSPLIARPFAKSTEIIIDQMTTEKETRSAQSAPLKKLSRKKDKRQRHKIQTHHSDQHCITRKNKDEESETVDDGDVVEDEIHETSTRGNSLIDPVDTADSPPINDNGWSPSILRSFVSRFVSFGVHKELETEPKNAIEADSNSPTQDVEDRPVSKQVNTAKSSHSVDMTNNKKRSSGSAHESMKENVDVSLSPFDTRPTRSFRIKTEIPPVCALILATDGVWDVLSEEEVAIAVANELSASGCVQSASHALVNEASARGSTDDISTCIAWFQKL